MGGRGWAGWSGVKGGNENCNSIINKYLKKTNKRNPKPNIIKMVIFPKLIYRFNIIPIKIPAEFTCLGNLFHKAQLTLLPP